MDNLTAPNDSSFMTTCPNNVVCLLEVMNVLTVASFTLFFNVSNLILLVSTPSFWNSHGYLLMSLSVADLGVGAVAALSVYPSATLRGSPDSWPYGYPLCVVASQINVVSLSNSGYTLTLLSLERYIAVAHPLKYSSVVTKRTTLSAIAVGWLTSSMSVIPFLTGYLAHQYNPSVYSCQTNFWDSNMFVVTVVSFVFIIPDILFIIITSAIVRRKLWENSRRRAAMIANLPPRSSQDSNSVRDTSCRSVLLFRMVRIMTITILVNWVPWLITTAVISFTDVAIPQVVTFTTYWLLLSNSWVNAVIYYTTNTKYRDRAHELTYKLVPRWCRKLNELEKRLTCTCCMCTRNAETYHGTSSEDGAVSKTRTSRNEIPKDSKVELVMVQIEGVSGIDNQLQNTANEQ